MTLKSRIDKVERDIQMIKILLVAGFIGGSGFTEVAKTLVGSPLWLDVVAVMLSVAIVLMVTWVIVMLWHRRSRR